jgi:D-serine deaminase-like pyridoxal phosphate-dependent protein
MRFASASRPSARTSSTPEPASAFRDAAPVTTVDDLETPSLLMDLDVVERNIAEMAGVAADAGVRLRPHAKTHKSPLLARMQLDAGAAGITVAKLGEAEIMADAGLDDLLLAYPVWGRRKLERLRAIRERARVRVGLDSTEVAEGLGRLGREARDPVEVLVEVDSGHGRLGRPPGAPTASLAAEIARISGVRVVGLMTHAGHSYRAASPEELAAAARREGIELVATAELCERAGLTVTEISVGSTPTARIAAFVPGVTEIRPGTYVFNDVQQMRLGVATEAACAASVVATVVARPNEERFVIDAGSKCLSSDGADGPAFPGRGVVAGRPDLIIDFLTEEHGIGRRTGDRELRIGDRLRVIPLHVCACVNLFDAGYGVRDGVVVDELPIAARGRVR